MDRDKLKLKWSHLVSVLTRRFSPGEDLDLDGILFLIGVQERGLGYKRFKKDEKLDLLHIAICKLLEPYGYYRLIGLDEQGWPHYEATEKLPSLKPGEQALLMKEAAVNYAEDMGWIE